MSWREVDRDFRYRITFVMWKCRACGRRAVTGGNTPSACVCSPTPAAKPFAIKSSWWF